MDFKQKLISYFFLFQLCNCSHIYSPLGIRGGDAIAELEEARTLANILVLPFQQRATRLDFSRIEPPFCSLSDFTLDSSLNGNSPSVFQLPASGEIRDLISSQMGNHFFRSQEIPISDPNLFINLKLQTIRTESNPDVNDDICRYRISTNCTGAMSSTHPGYFKILANEPTAIDKSFTLQPGLCMEIQCDNKATVRLRNDPRGGKDPKISTNFDVANFAFGTDLFNSLAKIQKDRYYDRSSFQSCKDTVILVSLLQARENLTNIAKFRTQRIQNRFCNTLTPSLSTQKGNLISNLVQGGACNLKEVGILGF